MDDDRDRSRSDRRDSAYKMGKFFVGFGVSNQKQKINQKFRLHF